MNSRRWVVWIVAGVLAVLPVLVAVGPAQAHQPSSSPPSAGAMPSAVPSAMTPQVDDGAVWSVAQVGNTLVMGGTFTSIGGVSRPYVAAIDATTGAVSDSFAASTNGQVFSVLPGPNDHTVFLGGSFTVVDGQPTQFLALVDTNTGQLVPGFTTPKFDYGMVRDLAMANGRLIVGGFFGHVGGRAHSGLAALNPVTGAVDHAYMNVQLAGHHNDSGSGAQGYIGTWTMDASRDGTKLVVGGNFTSADGLPREQVAMIDLTGSGASVDPNWATNDYQPLCFYWAFDAYVRGVSFSPDGSYVVVNTTGGPNPGTLCDATARFESASTGTDLHPTWIDQTGGDTVWGVTVTEDAVYIGGHNRWNNNPLGSDNAKPGAVPRPGLAALDPVSGRPYRWNPGHNPLGAAVYALLATPKGLWMGYDSNWIGNYKYNRQKIAFFPYDGGYTLPSTDTGRLPGTVYLGSAVPGPATNVLYRVDAGGPSITPSDGGPAWSADTSASPSPYVNQGQVADWGPVAKVDGSVPPKTPRGIFDHERYSTTDVPALTYSFPVSWGTHTEVRLYFANRDPRTSAPGQRVFNVQINGSTVLRNYDVAADVGDQTGVMKSFKVTAPLTGRITVTLRHVVNNPLIDGIEVLDTDNAPVPTDGLSSVAFDGTKASPAMPVSGTSIPWAQAHGGFAVGGSLFYGAGGYLNQAAIDGGDIGTPSTVDPYHDPVWDGVDTHDGNTFDGASPQLYSQLGNVTGMTYNAGRLYFTLANDPALHWAWFTPDSGIVDNTEFSAPSSTSFADADGMFVSGDTLYFVRRTDRSLYKVGFSDGSVTGTPQLVNGPGTGGIDWTNTALFFVPDPPANQAPNAAFTSSCSAGVCSFDASASADPDGSIASYSWDFGDGSPAGSGATPSHRYTGTGTFDVTLTVTDNDGATATVAHQVSIDTLGQQISFVGAAHTGPGPQTTKSLVVPTSAAPGDTMVLVLTSGTSTTWSGPGDGWTQVGSTATNVTIRSSMWVRTVVAGDPGSKVSFTSATAAKAVASLAVYHGVSATDPVDRVRSAGDSGGSIHTTPSLTATAGDWVVSWWTDKSTAVAAWTPPTGLTQRDATYDTGTSGRFSALIADSGAPIASADVPGATATTDSSSDKAIMWAVALRPGT